MYLSLLIFVPTILTMFCRIFGRKPSPATQEDSIAIKLLNRIISNGVEQSIVFMGLYFFFLFDKAGSFASIKKIDFALSN